MVSGSPGWSWMFDVSLSMFQVLGLLVHMTTCCSGFLLFWFWGFEFKIYQEVLIKQKLYINYSILFWKVLANKIAKSCDLMALLLDMVCFTWAIPLGSLKLKYYDFNTACILIYKDRNEVVLKTFTLSTNSELKCGCSFGTNQCVWVRQSSHSF